MGMEMEAVVAPEMETEMVARTTMVARVAMAARASALVMAMARAVDVGERSHGRLAMTMSAMMRKAQSASALSGCIGSPT